MNLLRSPTVWSKFALHTNRLPSAMRSWTLAVGRDLSTSNTVPTDSLSTPTFDDGTAGDVDEMGKDPGIAEDEAWAPAETNVAGTGEPRRCPEPENTLADADTGEGT